MNKVLISLTGIALVALATLASSVLVSDTAHALASYETSNVSDQLKDKDCLSVVPEYGVSSGYTDNVVFNSAAADLFDSLEETASTRPVFCRWVTTRRYSEQRYCARLITVENPGGRGSSQICKWEVRRVFTGYNREYRCD